jgi:NADPH2:quinone reductase
MVAGDYTPRNIDALAPGGRLVIIATQAGATSTINILKIMQKRAVLTGSTLRPRPVAFKAQVKQQLLEHVWPLLRSGQLRVIIDRTYPMQEAPLAHQRMESSEHIGKILLKVDG